jgi:hypothetical protein
MPNLCRQIDDTQPDLTAACVSHFKRHGLQLSISGAASDVG